MEKVVYDSKKMELIREHILEMIGIVAKLEKEFPDRHFTLDGHLIGSIGEVIAAYYYGIDLYKASAKIHDGEIGNKKVQIKLTQQDDIVINEEPEHLIVLYFNKQGTFYEVYNGPGKAPWASTSKRDSHNNRHMRVNKLMELDELVASEDRIRQVAPIALEKMKKEYKNKKAKTSK